MDFYRQLYQLLPFPVLLLNKSKEKKFCVGDFNKKFLKVFPQINNELIGAEFPEILSVLPFGIMSNMKEVQDALTTAIASGNPTVVKIAFNLDHGNSQEDSYQLEIIPILGKDETSKVGLIFKGEHVEHKNKLRENDERYRSIFEHSRDGVLFTVPDGRILAANPEACKMFRMTEKELVAAGRTGIVDTTDPRLSEALNKRKEKGEIKAELTYIRKDGTKFPVEVTSSIFKNAKNQERACIIIRDITQQKEAEEELKKSQEKYKLLFNYRPLPNWIYDSHTYKITEVNEAAIQLYGYSREEFLKLKITDLRPQEEISSLLAFIRNAEHKNGIVRNGRSNHFKKDGTLLKTEIWSYRFEKTNRTLVVSQDITEREETQKQLKEKSEKLAIAEKIARLGYWESDLKKNTRYWSEEVYNIWERDRDFFKDGPQSFFETIHPDDLENLQQEMNLTLSGKKEMNTEHRILLPNGKIKWVHEKGKLVLDKAGNPTGFQGSVQDITEHKTAMENLMVSEARQSSLLKSQTNYLIRTDLNESYTYCNEKFRKDFSWIFPDNEILGKNARATIKTYHLEKVANVFTKCIANPNQVYQIEIDKVQTDGGLKNTLWDLTCLTNAQGQPIEVQGVGIDITERVKAEKEIKFQARLLNTIGQAAIATDAKGKITYWNKAAEAIYGWTKEEATGQNIIDITPLHQTRQQVEEILSQLNKGVSWSGQFQATHKNGREFPAYITNSPLFDKKGNLTGIIGISSDITESKKLKEQLEKATSLSKIGSYEIDIKTGKVYWSPMIRKIHGVDSSFIPNLESVLSFYTAEDKKLMQRIYSEVVTKGSDFDVEVQILKSDGNQCWVRIMGQPEFDGSTCTSLSGSFQDIDKIKRAELQILKASEEKERILESIGDAFFALDHHWNVTYWNSEAEKILEHSKHFMIGKNIIDIFDIRNTTFEAFYRKAVEENQTQHFESYFEGTKSWYEVNAYPSQEGLSVFFKDITARKNTNCKLMELNQDLQTYTEELVAANKGLEQFSYIISHNLRAPVANILGVADLLNTDYPQEIKDTLLKELVGNVKRLDGVISDLNQILQVKNDFGENKETVHLEQLVSSIGSSLQNLINKEQVEIQTDFSECTELTTVPGYLHSIFYNLIFNSIKFRRSGANPFIKIKSRKTDGKLLIIFEDNGLGIDLDRKGEQVFGLYKRFHHHVEGKGMGLFMVKTQVEMLGGKISVTSEVNKGTVFTIEWNEDNINLAAKDDTTTPVHSN